MRVTRTALAVGAPLFVLLPEAGYRSTPDEERMLDKMLADDRAALASLVTLHHSALIRLALVYVGNRAIAEEVVQDTWGAVLNGLRSFERRSSLKTWIFHILANRARTRAVREGRSVPPSSLGDVEKDRESEVDPSRFTASGMWADPPHAWRDELSDSTPVSEEEHHTGNAAMSLATKTVSMMRAARTKCSSGDGWAKWRGASSMNGSLHPSRSSRICARARASA